MISEKPRNAFELFAKMFKPNSKLGHDLRDDMAKIGKEKAEERTVKVFSKPWSPCEGDNCGCQQKTIGQTIFDDFEAWYRKENNGMGFYEIFEFPACEPEKKIVELINKAFSKNSQGG